MTNKKQKDLFDENDCAWCGKKFKSKVEHDKHYTKCAEENVNDKYTDDEIFDLVNNENNY